MLFSEFDEQNQKIPVAVVDDDGSLSTKKFYVLVHPEFGARNRTRGVKTVFNRQEF